MLIIIIYHIIKYTCNTQYQIVKLCKTIFQHNKTCCINPTFELNTHTLASKHHSNKHNNNMQTTVCKDFHFHHMSLSYWRRRQKHTLFQ